MQGMLTYIIYMTKIDKAYLQFHSSTTLTSLKIKKSESLCVEHHMLDLNFPFQWRSTIFSRILINGYVRQVPCDQLPTFLPQLSQFSLSFFPSQAIVDTGKTMKTLLEHVEAFRPKMIKVAGQVMTCLVNHLVYPFLSRPRKQDRFQVPLFYN